MQVDILKNIYNEKKQFSIIALSLLISGCCSWDYNKKDFEFTQEELAHLGPYKVGDTIYFQSNLGDIDTITVLKISEEREKGNKCFISKPPYHGQHIIIKHLPDDKWAGTSQSEGEAKKIIYQSLISISKYPLDTIAKVSYGISFKGFTTLQNVLGHSPKDTTINNKTIYQCYKVSHGYPERVTNSNDIEFVYWTDQYGLTAYRSKSGETWIIRNLK